MSSYEYCERGGQEGIYTTTGEQVELAELLIETYRDTYIPLPKFTPEKQKEIIENVPHDHDEVVDYWENESGRHGWCCSQCGKVIQWG